MIYEFEVSGKLQSGTLKYVEGLQAAFDADDENDCDKYGQFFCVQSTFSFLF